MDSTYLSSLLARVNKKSKSKRLNINMTKYKKTQYKYKKCKKTNYKYNKIQTSRTQMCQNTIRKKRDNIFVFVFYPICNMLCCILSHLKFVHFVLCHFHFLSQEYLILFFHFHLFKPKNLNLDTKVKLCHDYVCKVMMKIISFSAKSF